MEQLSQQAAQAAQATTKATAQRPAGETGGKPAGQAAAKPQQGYFQRFTRLQVAEHLALVLSFTALALTGLPQKFASGPAGSTLIAWMGGIERVRAIHHFFAWMMIGESVFHVLHLLYRWRVYGRHTDMLPGLQDVRDFVHSVRYNLGLEERPPAFGKYGFKEKFEYWALVWGTVVMSITGLIMMYPERFTRVLPGLLVPAARATHSGEALLAVLAIAIWHMYNAHLRPEVFPIDTSIFTGRVSMERMEEEHPLELARLGLGSHPSPSSPAGLSQAPSARAGLQQGEPSGGPERAPAPEFTSAPGSLGHPPEHHR